MTRIRTTTHVPGCECTLQGFVTRIDQNKIGAWVTATARDWPPQVWTTQGRIRP